MTFRKNILFLFVVSFFLLPTVRAQDTNYNYLNEENWVDSIFSQLTLEQKIGQLMVLRVPPSNNVKKMQELYANITQYYAGGVCFFGGTSVDQLNCTKKIQTMAPIPLFISMDAEWGLGMRLTDAYSFPRQMMMGAMPDDSLLYKMGKEVALQCKKMGIHINFAPCVDINSNPKNPVIGARSFGENKENVARKGIMYAKGLQNNGVMAVAKHFPGHGDTDVDSHVDLPVINHTKEYLEQMDLYPFQKLINSGVDGVMVGHLQVNAYDERKNMPSSLSPYLVNDVLRKQMKFKGLIFTDGMDMKAITNNYKNGNAELTALLAGIDMMVLPDNMENAVKAISKACENDSLLIRLINLKCRKVLRAKFQYGLHTMDVSQLSLPNKDDWQRCEALTRSIAEKSLTVVKNKNFILPLQELHDKKILSILMGTNSRNVFTNVVDSYVDCRHMFVPGSCSLDSLLVETRKYDIVIVSVYGYANPTSRRNYGITDEMLKTIDAIQQQDVKVILVGFTSPYAFSQFENMKNLNAVVIGYQNVDAMQSAAATAIFGGAVAQGCIPVTAGNFAEGLGKTTNKIRLGERTPEQMNMEPKCFATIDSIVQRGIAQKAYPGCQVLVAKDGYIVHNKSYGNYTYDSDSSPVTNETLYDVASVTKIAATTLAVMKLVDTQKIKLDDPLSMYLPYLKHTNKADITIKEALSHIARLQAFVPFWKDAVKENKVEKGLHLCNHEDSNNYVQIADHFFVEKDYREEILHKIADTKLLSEKKYVYSDFGFILLGDLVEKVSGVPLDVFMKKHFYQPLEMEHTAFNPLQSGFSIQAIAPTENDNHFRFTQIQGYVHDENAALMGGVAGHAGLFSNATDLANLFQLLLNKGIYGKQSLLSKEVIDKFNTRYYVANQNRRALGFDKPLISGKNTHVSTEVSSYSFGHSGFTGTFVWVDPKYDIVYIFLSNRVYPNVDDNKLSKLNIRTDIQEQIYKSLNIE